MDLKKHLFEEPTKIVKKIVFFCGGDVFFCVIEGKKHRKTFLNDTEGRKKTPKGVKNTKILKKPFELLGKNVSTMSIIFTLFTNK